MLLRPLALAALIASLSLPAFAQDIRQTVGGGLPTAVAPTVQGVLLTGDAATAAIEAMQATRRAAWEAQEAQRIADNQPTCLGNFYTTTCHYPDGSVETYAVDRTNVPPVGEMVSPTAYTDN